MPKKVDLVKQALRDEEGAREDVRREMAQERKVAAAAKAAEATYAVEAAKSMAQEAACAEAAAAWEKEAATSAAAGRIQRFYRLRKSIKDFWEEFWDKEAEALEAEMAEMAAEEERWRDWSQESCRVCGRPCDDDWGWTGHCSRGCATSYDRRERRGW